MTISVILLISVLGSLTVAAASPFNETRNILFDNAPSNNYLDPGRVLLVTLPEEPSCSPAFSSVAVRSLHEDLFEDVFKLLLNDGVFFNSEDSRSKSPYMFRSPSSLEGLIDFKLGQNGENHNQLLDYLKNVLKYSPHVSHPFYLSKSGSGLDPYGLAADWLGTTMTNIPLNYNFGPVYTLMEISVIQKLRQLIGYPSGNEPGGTVIPDTSVGNAMALNLALQRQFPNYREKGIVGDNATRLAIFISADASSSFEKTQIFSGLPSDSLVRIKVDNDRRLCAKTLEAEVQKALKSGVIPVMVVATAGTPSLGAIDPISEIARICLKYNVWLHVDADRAGACLLSSNQITRLQGIELSDSVSWSASQILGSPHTTSFLLTKDNEACRNAFDLVANYVFFHNTLYNGSYDVGDTTIQTSRRPEVIKTWLMWKARGIRGLAAHVDRTYENLEFFVSELKSSNRNQSFRLILDTFDTPLVSFVYVPQELREIQNSTKFTDAMNKLTLELKKVLLTRGIMQISLSSSPDLPTFYFTLSLFNTALTKEDLVYIINQISYHGEQQYTGLENASLKPSLSKAPTTYPDFVSAPIEAQHGQLYAQLFQLFLKKGLFFQDKRKEPALCFQRPEVLEKLMDFELTDNGAAEGALLEYAEKIIEYSPHYSHPYWMYQLTAGLDPYSMISDYVGSAINSPMTTYEDSPAFTLMENEVLFQMRKILGYPNGDGDGVVADGGSMCNMLATALARYHKFSSTKNGGNTVVGKKMAFYVSEDAHYSFKKGSFMQGHGLENAVLVKTDERGRMLVSELRKAIELTLNEGNVPFMVAATAGTTILGAIDPLEEVADICKEFGLWFHVDGVFGGAVIMSDKHRSRLRGVERSDSFGLNFHKVFGGTHTMSVLVSRHQDIFTQSLGISDQSDLLRSSDRLYDRNKFDQNGDKQLQVTQRANVLKIWFLWKARGTSGMGAHIDYIYDRVNTLTTLLKGNPEKFELVLPEFDLTNVSFYYIPKRLRGAPKNTEYFEELGKIAPKLYQIMAEEGILNLVTQNLGRGQPSFLKVPIMSSGVTDEDLKYVVKVIDAYGQNL